MKLRLFALPDPRRLGGQRNQEAPRCQAKHNPATVGGWYGGVWQRTPSSTGTETTRRCPVNGHGKIDTNGH
jgi:hypothetical protein